MKTTETPPPGSLSRMFRRRPVECPCCGTKRNESHRGWCPAPTRMNNLPDAAKVGDRWGAYRLHSDGWWLLSPNDPSSPTAPKKGSI